MTRPVKQLVGYSEQVEFCTLLNIDFQLVFENQWFCSPLKSHKRKNKLIIIPNYGANSLCTANTIQHSVFQIFLNSIQSFRHDFQIYFSEPAVSQIWNWNRAPFGAVQYLERNEAPRVDSTLGSKVSWTYLIEMLVFPTSASPTTQTFMPVYLDISAFNFIYLSTL